MDVSVHTGRGAVCFDLFIFLNVSVHIGSSAVWVDLSIILPVQCGLCCVDCSCYLNPHAVGQRRHNYAHSTVADYMTDLHEE